MPTRFESVRRAARIVRDWRRRHAVAILVAVGLVGVVCAGVVVAGSPRADGDLATLSGLLITWPVIQLLDRAFAPPDWRFGAALGTAALILMSVWFGFDWEPAHYPTVLLILCLLAKEPRSTNSPDWPRQPRLEQRIEEQRAREERMRQEYPEEFRPVPWERAN